MFFGLMGIFLLEQPTVIFATPANNAEKAADSRKTTDPGGGEEV